jgi:hypothetical protein
MMGASLMMDSKSIPGQEKYEINVEFSTPDD